MNGPLSALLVPLAVAALLPLLAGRMRWCAALSAAGAAVLASRLLPLIPDALGGTPAASGTLGFGPGLTLALAADPAGLLFALVAAVLWGATSVYAAGYLEAVEDRAPARFYALLAVCLAAAVAIALAANLVTFVVAYEVLSVATWPLVAHTGTDGALRSGRKYLAYALVGGQCLLVAAVWADMLGPGGFAAGGALPAGGDPTALRVIFTLFVVGVGIKAAVMPLHGWLPAAMVAPVPVSALLHAVAVVKAGAFGLLRVSGWVFGPDLMHELGLSAALAAAAAATILIASLRALAEDNLKRRLAYSTVGQLSYIALGAALATPAALAGALFHIAAHGFLKITLFFCAGAVYAAEHVEKVSDLGGVGRRMPVTMGAFALAALGLAGLPGLAGFLSKWNLGWGALEAGRPAFVAVLVASGLLNLAYFLPIVHAAFLGGSEPRRFAEPSPALWVPPALTALGAIWLGLSPDAWPAFYRLAWAAASAAAGVLP